MVAAGVDDGAVSHLVVAAGVDDGAVSHLVVAAGVDDGALLTVSRLRRLSARLIAEDK